MSNKKPWLIVIASVVVIFVLAYLVKPSSDKKETQPIVSSSTPAQIGVGALGRIEPRSRVITVSHDEGPEGARIETLLVSEGQLVAEDDILAYFSNHFRKEAELSAAAANIDVLQARLQASEAEFATASRDYDRNKKLLNKNIVSEAKQDEVQLRYYQAQASVAALKAEVQSAKANLVLAEEQLKQTILTAPIGGTILKIHSFPGERVSDKGVLEMANLEQMDVVAEVYERDISKIKPDQAAVIKVPGMEGDITGTVREIGFQVSKSDINNTDPLADRDIRTVDVRISVAQGKAELLRHLIYMQVNVRIVP